jgi:hypothetical protein
MKSKSTTFEFSKETKGTKVFTETPKAGEPPIIGTIYVQKWLLPADAKQLRVTVEIPESDKDITALKK